MEQERLLWASKYIHIPACTSDYSGYNFVCVGIQEGSCFWSKETECASVVLGGGFFASFCFVLCCMALRGAQRSLVGCRLWGRTESDTTEAT